jgi:hypothetical protein
MVTAIRWQFRGRPLAVIGYYQTQNDAGDLSASIQAFHFAVVGFRTIRDEFDGGPSLWIRRIDWRLHEKC